MKRTSVVALLAIALSLALVNGCSKQITSAEAAGNDGSSSVPFHHSSQPTVTQATVPAGTPVAIRMQTAVSSKTASAGQHFQAVLDEPITIEGKTVAPRGADVTGRVVSARSSGRLHKPGYLRLTLDSITLDGGAGAGALIGALAGGPKGALIGSAIGAGAGTGTAYATGKKEVGIGVERRLTFRLIQPLTTQTQS